MLENTLKPKSTDIHLIMVPFQCTGHKHSVPDNCHFAGGLYIFKHDLTLKMFLLTNLFLPLLFLLQASAFWTLTLLFEVHLLGSSFFFFLIITGIHHFFFSFPKEFQSHNVPGDFESPHVSLKETWAKCPVTKYRF